MRSRFLTLILGAAAMLGMAVPGNASPVMSFAPVSSTDGTVTLNSSGYVTAISGVTFSMFIGTGVNSFGTTLSEVSNSGVLTLVANQAFTGYGPDAISSGETLLTINLLNATTSLKDSNASGTGLYINLGGANISSIVVDPNLLADLGWSSPTPLATLSGLLQGGAGTGTYGTTSNLDSNTLGVALTATPEPASFLLFGGGLLCIGLARRKLSPRP